MWSSNAGLFEALLPKAVACSFARHLTLSCVLLHCDILMPSFFCNFSDIVVMRFSEHTFVEVNVNLPGMVP